MENDDAWNNGNITTSQNDEFQVDNAVTSGGMNGVESRVAEGDMSMGINSLIPGHSATQSDPHNRIPPFPSWHTVYTSDVQSNVHPPSLGRPSNPPHDLFPLTSEFSGARTQDLTGSAFDTWRDSNVMSSPPSTSDASSQATSVARTDPSVGVSGASYGGPHPSVVSTGQRGLHVSPSVGVSGASYGGPHQSSLQGAGRG